MNELRKSNLLCDASISTKNSTTEESVEYPVHRFILAGMSLHEECCENQPLLLETSLKASSPYLRMALTNMQHSEHPSLELDVECDILERLLDFAYTRRCALTLDNVSRTIDAAKLCQMTSLFQYCCEYLIVHLNDENIFQLYAFARVHADVKLVNATYAYLM